MFDSLKRLFSSDFMPHGHCYFWRPDILWLNVGSDLLITLSYYCIPILLLLFVRSRKDLAFNWMFGLFATFIFLCGTTHIFDIWTVWHPLYGAQGLVKLVTGLVSAATAVMLWYIMPRLIALPSAEDLKSEVEYRRRLQELTERDKSELEARVNERTAQLQLSLAEKEVLLREVHHRVKNNLQVISSLLKLQANTLNGSPACKLLLESEDRVRSIALVHEKLYRSESLSKVDFKSYIEELLRSLVAAHNVTGQVIDLKIEVDAVEFNIEKAIPCGLMINELVSNSLKHAFVNSPAGEIVVRLSKRDNSYLLVVKDTGVGLPNTVNVASPVTLGLKIVRTLATQLGAAVSVSNNVGTAFEIRFDDVQKGKAENERNDARNAV